MSCWVYLAHAMSATRKYHKFHRENDGAILPSSLSPTSPYSRSATPRSARQRRGSRASYSATPRSRTASSTPTRRRTKTKKGDESILDQYRVPILAAGGLLILGGAFYMYRRSQQPKEEDDESGLNESEALDETLPPMGTPRQEPQAAREVPLVPLVVAGRIQPFFAAMVNQRPVILMLRQDGTIDVQSLQAFQQRPRDRPLRRVFVGNVAAMKADPSVLNTVKSVPFQVRAGETKQWMLSVQPEGRFFSFVVQDPQTRQEMKAFTLNYVDAQGRENEVVIAGSPDHQRHSTAAHPTPPAAAAPQPQAPPPPGQDYDIANVREAAAVASGQLSQQAPTTSSSAWGSSQPPPHVMNDRPQDTRTGRGSRQESEFAYPPSPTGAPRDPTERVQF